MPNTTKHVVVPGRLQKAALQPPKKRPGGATQIFNALRAHRLRTSGIRYQAPPAGVTAISEPCIKPQTKAPGGRSLVSTKRPVPTCKPEPACQPAKKPRTTSLAAKSATTLRPSIKSSKKLAHLRAFNAKYLGMEDYDTTEAKLGEQFYNSISNSYDIRHPVGHWKHAVPTAAGLLRSSFGRPDLSHSFIQTPCLETCVTHLFKSGFLNPTDMLNLMDVSPLFTHLAASIVAYSDYDFRWIRDYNLNWNEQTTIDPDRRVALTAALFHYNLNVSALMRYLGNNYTGEHRNIPLIINKLRSHSIPEDLISKYTRVMLVGCPNHFVAETSRDNTMLYFRKRNGPTIARKLEQVWKNMNKEDKNNFVIPLPHWLARFIPHLFFTPQHVLEVPGKKDRQIFDGSKRYDSQCTSLNMMTSTRFGTEDDCLFGNVRE
eukprot:scaffold21809_cov24-Cyclotella_meneghiniana.AAC.3